MVKWILDTYSLLAAITVPRLNHLGVRVAIHPIERVCVALDVLFISSDLRINGGLPAVLDFMS